LGRLRVAEPDVLSVLLDIIATANEPPRRMLPPILVIRPGHAQSLALDVPSGCHVEFEIAGDEIVAAGEASSAVIELPDDLPLGSFRLRIAALIDGETRTEQTTLLCAPQQAYQGEESGPQRSWALAVQLYGIRSHRNWGHGDFTDLARLIDLAAQVGAAG